MVFYALARYLAANIDGYKNNNLELKEK